MISLVGVTEASPVRPVAIAKRIMLAAFLGAKKIKAITIIARNPYKIESEFFMEILEHKMPHKRSPAIVAIPKIM